jgi:hypothetical protein
VLGFLRFLTLTCVESVVKFYVYWKPKDEATYRRWKRLLASPYLRRVVVRDTRVVLGEKISDHVRRLEMELYLGDDEDDIWPMFEKDLLVSASLEEVLVFYLGLGSPASLASSRAGAEFYALFSTVRKLHFCGVGPRPEFWDGFETFDNIVEAGLFCHHLTTFTMGQAGPLHQFANLRLLRLVVTNSFFRQQFDVVMPQLETLELTVWSGGSASEIESAGVLNHNLASLVPNLRNLSVDAHLCSTKDFHPDVLAVAVPESFSCLQRLKVRGDIKLKSAQNVIDRFQAVRPGGVKEIIIKGAVHYFRPECLKVCTAVTRWVKRKKRQNRQFTFDLKWDFSWAKAIRHSAEHVSRSCYTLKFSQP